MDTGPDPFPDPDRATWCALSEVVGDRYRVSIATAPGRWAECTFPATADMTHPRAVTTAVERFTGRHVTTVTPGRPQGDGCPSFRLTLGEEINAMTQTPDTEIVVRTFTENGCIITAVIADPADAQQTLYGTVTRDGLLVGSYYCADRVWQRDWRIVVPGNQQICLGSEGEAVYVLTTAGSEGAGQ
ncbi:hypothetical protein [Amycolatopsis sacchari]|uniref:hypothetical protein n=1 Tax=Amycolatopsis sacchari TaxID=115433 RepID=UPI003D72C46A